MLARGSHNKDIKIWEITTGTELMTLLGKDNSGKPVELEIMLPHAMVKLVMSLHGEHGIGFGA